ncbi:MAG: helix-turn-helix domain-containing protein [Lachnospiraceae bacterium]|nr:helix-turn-helix domain-containing protein [Lachnospiraceae bacterium]
MKFSEKLKRAMQELQINQAKVASLTGKSKGSISQYLSDQQIPPEKVQRDIAVSLGLAPDYFEQDETAVNILPHIEVRNGVIPRLRVTDAAKLLRMNHTTVEKGLQQGVFPWGYGIMTSVNPETGRKNWTYFINANRFAAIEGVGDIANGI